MIFSNTRIGHKLMRLGQVLAVVLLFGASIARSEPPDVFKKTFPKIAGIYIGGNVDFEDPAVRDLLSKHHLTVYGFWPQFATIDASTGVKLSMADVVSDIRKRAVQNDNAGILITQYTNVTESYSPQSSIKSRVDVADKLFSESGPHGNWWAKNAAGEHVSTYPNNWVTNITRFTTPDQNGDRFPEWVAKREHNVFFASGIFDGQFNDIFNYRPPKDMDWNGDGKTDSRNDETVRELYRQGHVDGLNEVAKLRPNSFVIGNVNCSPETNEGMLTEPEYKGRVVGLYEAAAGPTWATESYGGWKLMMKGYQTLVENSLHRAAILNIHGDKFDYQTLRYGLASALMGDGYFSYSDGYSDVLWYDEFDVDLGLAIDPLQTSPWKQGVYMRRFEGGMAIVNPKGNGTQSVSIPSGYRRIDGVQDPATNNGAAVSTVTLADRDGIILVAVNATRSSRPKPPVLSSTD
jgi:hypothetical protein